MLFMAEMEPNSLAIFNSNDIYPISADSVMPFEQHRDLFYLSGIDQEESIIILFPDAINPKHKEIAFVKKTNSHIAIWEGPKLNKEETYNISGIKTVYWLEDFKDIFPDWSKISIDYSWRGFIAMSQKLTPSIGKIENEEIYYGFGYHGVGVSTAPWTGKQLSKLVFSSNSKDLNISKIYKGLPKKFIFPKLRVFYFRLAVMFYNIKDKLNI